MKHWLFLLLTALFTGCAGAVKTTAAAKENFASHKTIAILPFEVGFDLRKNNQKQFTEADMGKLKQFMALGLQAHLYYWLQGYGTKHPYTVTIQHCDSTNKILSENKVRFADVYHMSRFELAKLLQVDAVLTPQVLFKQPNSETVAMLINGASALINPLSPSSLGIMATQEMNMQVLINDTHADSVIWSYNNTKANAENTKHSNKKRKENILYPLFDNINNMLLVFIKKFPYSVKRK